MSYFPAVKIQATGTINGTATTTPYDVTQHNQRLDCNVLIDDGVNLDAFSRLRVSTPGYRFDGQFTYQINNDNWDTTSTGGGAVYDATNRMVVLSTNATAGANVTVLQSHYHAPYTPGRSQLSFTTFNFKVAPTSGITKRAGNFDGNNGIFIEWDATTGVSVNIASNSSNGSEQALQANWNLDKLDGTGPSGVTLDLTKTQIFFASYQSLYVGRVVVGFDIDGQLVPVHAFTHANKIAFPYFQQASQPIRYELRGTNAAASSMDAICASVISEGGAELVDMPGRVFSANNASTAVVVNGALPVISIRLKSNFNGVRNNTVALPQSSGLLNTSNTSVLYYLVRNGTVSGGAWSNVDATNSAVEVNTTATGITGGSVVFSDYISAQNRTASPTLNNQLSRLVLAYSYVLPANNADTLSIVALTVGGGNSNVYGAMTWKEIR